MSARLYGRTVGNGSLAVVTGGFKRALEAAGVLEGTVSLDRSGGSDEEDGPPGALARDGVFTGNLSHLPLMQRNARHERHWVQVTPNSTHVPPKLLDAVTRLPNVRIMSASAWGANVICHALQEMFPGLISLDGHGDGLATIERDGVPPVNIPILTMGHGVHGFAPHQEELQKTRADYRAGKFRVVHFSTSDGERKGTLELIRGWEIARAWRSVPTDAELLLVLDHHARQALHQRLLDHEVVIPQSVRVLPRADMGPGEMSRFLCQQHLLAAPSRGEGFGLTVLEARASGVPSIATLTTGHSAGHCRGGGVIRIFQHDTLHPIDDGPEALAPGVHPDEIAVALKTAYVAWYGMSHMSEALSEGVRRDWSWESQLAPLVEELRR